MSTAIEIRPVTADDFAAWLPLWQGYQQFYKTTIADEVTQQTWLRFLDESEPMHAVLAWQGEAAVGMVHYIDHRSCWTSGNYVYLQDLFVNAQVRGGGVGRQLIQHVYDYGAETGASRVWWLTQETNTTAMKLYDQVADKPGFVQYRKML